MRLSVSVRQCVFGKVISLNGVVQLFVVNFNKEINLFGRIFFEVSVKMSSLVYSGGGCGGNYHVFFNFSNYYLGYQSSDDSWKCADIHTSVGHLNEFGVAN